MDDSVRLQQIQALYLEYTHAIDEDELERWPGFFTERCLYQVIPRENDARGHPASLIWCDRRAMLEDRVVALRNANIYNLHWDRHLMSPPWLKAGAAPGSFVGRAQFAVCQTDPGGNTRLFAAGVYRDLIVFDGEQPRFKERVVVLDSFNVQELLATPI